MTDNAGQVVAVQLVEDAPCGRWLDPNVHPTCSNIYNSDLNLFNIIENRAKSISNGLVGVQITRLDENVLRVDSEFLSTQLNSRECVSLYIAQPVVDLVLHLIETRYETEVRGQKKLWLGIDTPRPLPYRLPLALDLR